MLRSLFGFACLLGVLATPFPPVAAAAKPTPYRLIVSEHLAKYIAGSTESSMLDGTQPIVVLDAAGGAYDATAPFAPASWNAKYLVRFTSATDLARAFAQKTVPGFVTFVLFEDAAAAPPAASYDPAAAYRDVEAIVRANHRFLIASAGRSGELKAILPTAGAWTGYLARTQDDETDLGGFYRAIATTTTTVWSQRANLPIAVSLTDFVGGMPVSAPAIESALSETPRNAVVLLDFAPANDGLALTVIEATATKPRPEPYRTTRPVRALIPTLFDHSNK